jgi:three-Cys-motif partner protein
MGLIFDEIGYWSEVKLEIIKEYASAYSKILGSRRGPELYHIYIDAFAGPGMDLCRLSLKIDPVSLLKLTHPGSNRN